MHVRARRTLIASLLTLAPLLAHAGPPLLCHPMSIGDARSLPWGSGSGWNTPRSDYERTHLAQDTLALLVAQTPVLVRMETLRRAAIYASTDAAAARALVGALRTRQLKAEPADALAQFDLGYAVEVLRQMRSMRERLDPSPAEDGYALVRQALKTRGADAEMEYAAALMTCGERALRPMSEKHLRAALEGLRQDSDLARTIAAHRPMWGESLTTARAAAAR